MTDHTGSQFSLYSVFACPDPSALAPGGAVAAAAAIEAAGAEVRGYYDIGGYRAEADLMVWFTADQADKVQDAYRGLRRAFGPGLVPVWSVMGTVTAAEFNKQHWPGYLSHDAQNYMAVYPFVRSYEWYVMDPAERSRILRDHGAAGAPFDDATVSTLATFALSDYEWVIAVEAETPQRISELMRAFRNTEARLHVRVEIPFYTGRRVTLEEWVARQ
ncbi:MAG: hydrogen peroxide-dependent heme synthase [Actinomycetaceae bacterium]|nr:chlorite dismutase family protein [Actinomycetaceae bacterium]MDY6083581.1 hydrogen peroxide-dependent heme synthase [Actinomycetaceae bacterium]